MKSNYYLTMRSLALLAISLMIAPETANAQAWLRRLTESAVNAANNAANQAVNNAVDDAVRSGVNDAVDGIRNSNNSDDDAEQSPTNDNETGETVAPEEASAPTPRAIEASYAKSDFVSGNEVFFDDPMEGEQMGEFPSKWDLIEGEAEVARIDGKNCISMRVDASTTIEPLMKDQRHYLPDVFTIEFDFYRGKTESSMGYIVQLGNENRSDAVEITISGQHSTEMNGNVSYYTPSDDYRNSEFTFSLEGNTWNHFALSFNKRALKVYINGTRVANIPNCVKTDRLFIKQYSWGGFDDSGTNAVTNVKLCQGAVPLYDRLATDGKIVTYAITFETGKADLKPESMTEITRIANLMKEKTDLKFEVQGHCDNTGSDAVNDPLSQKRAEAIVEALVKQGIDRKRLTAVGKGSHSPIADNSTDEGRAKNRRVEFVKK